ncbi:hypothetical protein F4824DRAFT_509504 [Ustulina deusta]|nr:hypothetical protein F4824DRAFT_509504 [Ustulina deusta]
MAKRNRTAMTRTCVLETVDGTVRVRERWQRKNLYKGPPDLPEDFRFSERVERCLDALQVLQLKRNQYLLGETLAVPLQFLHDSLPYMVQPDVNIFRPVQEDIWSLPLNGDFDKLAPELDYFTERHEEALASRRYHFWPIDVSRGGENDPPHWALIVLHLSHRREEGQDPDTSDDPLTGPYNFLDSYAVIDPDHGSTARDLEEEIATLLQHVLPKMGITVGTRSTRENPWVPPRNSFEIVNAPQLTSAGARENWSSGIRVFEMVRVWLDRLTEYYCQEPHRHDRSKFWGPHPGWLNLDAVRSNMIGIAATMVNRAMNGTTRVAIEPIVDNAMRTDVDELGVLTQTMMPSRRRLGAFIPEQSRRHPSFINDTPAEDDEDKADESEPSQNDASEHSSEDEDEKTEEDSSDEEALKVVAKKGRAKKNQVKKTPAKKEPPTKTPAKRKRKN